MRIRSELRPYQDRISAFCYEHDEALVILRPGGGKTIAALTAIVDLLREGEIRHALIIAPKRVARIVWPDEIGEWAHTTGLRYAVLDGTPAERSAQLLTARQRDLTIAGIDILPWVLGTIHGYALTDPIWDLLVIDEISRLRNPTGVRFKSLAREAHRWRMVWGLTGTLRPNSALDLFAPVRVVTRGKLWGKSFYRWRAEHFRPVDWQGYDWRPLPGTEEKLNVEMAPLTAMVADGEMPQVEPLMVLDRVALPPAAWREYERMQRTLMAEIEGEPVIASSAAIATGKLAQLANGFVYDEDKATHWVHDAKREWLSDVIETATGPTLLIYEYLADLDLMQALLPGLPYLGAGISDRKAARYIADWNAGKLPFMALAPASGGHGLNLQHGGADMAWFSPTWSPELFEQTIARLARSGQTRTVVVRVCIAAGTVDELKLNRVHHKMSAQVAFENWMRRWHAVTQVA
jgi:hypothetical protein